MNHQSSSECPTAETQANASAVVLVVDDEPSICWGFERMLAEDGHEVLTASSAEDGLEIAKQQNPSLILLDVRLPREDGITALPKFIEASNGSPVIVMTAFGDLETAVAAVERGASDYLTKPFRLEDAQRVCRNALRSCRSSASLTTPTSLADWDNERIVGTSSAIQHAFRQIALVASSDLSVLVTGETGTGKELVAAAIHRHSRRAEMPYLRIAPIALNPDLIESELFGHVRGAFTGATSDRAGLFEAAEGGTVLLDEIGDLPLAVQVKLLRVLEQGEYCRVGEVESRYCNVRIIAATNADLHDAVQEGRFREDLYYRLNGLHIHLPPLRQRPEDIGHLCKHFLGRLNYPDLTRAVDQSLLDQLSVRPWRGNVRELRNAVEHAAVVARGRSLRMEDFPKEQPDRTKDASPSQTLSQAISSWASAKMAMQSEEDDGLHSELLAEIEPVLFRLVLSHTQGNRAKAAELLGIHRGTLRDKLRAHAVDDTSSQ